MWRWAAPPRPRHCCSMKSTRTSPTWRAQLGAERALLAYRACAASFEHARAPLSRAAAGSLTTSGAKACTWPKNEGAVAALQAELAARRAAGFACEWLEQRRAAASLSVAGAPAQSCRRSAPNSIRCASRTALMAGVERHGVRVVRAHAASTEITERGAGLRLTTEGGHTVDAAHVIVAAGFESLDFLPRQVADIDNTYALVTEPLADRQRATRLPLIWESARPYLYLRGTPDGRLMLGGADVPFKNAAARDLLLPRQVRAARCRATASCLARSCRRSPMPGVAVLPRRAMACRSSAACPACIRHCYSRCVLAGTASHSALHAGDMVRAAIEGRDHPLAECSGSRDRGRVAAQRGDAAGNDEFPQRGKLFRPARGPRPHVHQRHRSAARFRAGLRRGFPAARGCGQGLTTA